MVQCENEFFPLHISFFPCVHSSLKSWWAYNIAIARGDRSNISRPKISWDVWSANKHLITKGLIILTLMRRLAGQNESWDIRPWDVWPQPNVSYTLRGLPVRGLAVRYLSCHRCALCALCNVHRRTLLVAPKVKADQFIHIIYGTIHSIFGMQRCIHRDSERERNDVVTIFFFFWF